MSRRTATTRLAAAWADIRNANRRVIERHTFHLQPRSGSTASR